MRPENSVPQHGRRSAGRPTATVGATHSNSTGSHSVGFFSTETGPAQSPSAGRRSAKPAVANPQAHTKARTKAQAQASASAVVAKPLAAWQRHIAVGASAIALIAGLSIAPAHQAQAEPAPADSASQSHDSAQSQSLDVGAELATPAIARDVITATDGVQTLTSNGTNEDWAKLVLMDGGWTMSQPNVDFMMRWMRQENGSPDWWNRNNPLNNGYGSGGGAGFGSYPDLGTAAQYAADNLQRGYPAVVAGLVAGTSADITAQAIWASPWASSHYGYGSHWSTSPVNIVKAPASAW